MALGKLTRLDLSRGYAPMAATDAAALIGSCTSLRWLGAPAVRQPGELKHELFRAAVSDKHRVRVRIGFRSWSRSGSIGDGSEMGCRLRSEGFERDRNRVGAALGPSWLYTSPMPVEMMPMPWSPAQLLAERNAGSACAPNVA